MHYCLYSILDILELGLKNRIVISKAYLKILLNLFHYTAKCWVLFPRLLLATPLGIKCLGTSPFGLKINQRFHFILFGLETFDRLLRFALIGS